MLKIEIDTSNAAFDDSLTYEVNMCFDRISRKLAQGDTKGAIMDSNGNQVGHFTLTEED